MVLYTGTDERDTNESVRNKTWRFSSVGRASALQAEGQGFKSLNLHHVPT